MTNLPLWIVVALVLGWLCAIILGILLWSSRTQRDTRVRPSGCDGLDTIFDSVLGLTQSTLVEGNTVEILQNGDGFFPRLLQDFRDARHHVHFESYVWWEGDICHELADTLCDRARAGVEVRVVLDAIGSLKMAPELRRDMENAGVQICTYHGFRLRTLGRLNSRTHRKLAVVDGRIGYVHSHGIAKEWQGCGDGPSAWRDTGARLTGPIVGHVQSVFCQHWMEESAKVLAAAAYFPELSPTGDVAAHLVASSPRGGVSNVSILVRLMLVAAREELLVQNPYFAPDHDLVDLLVDAVRRGVRVRVMVPGPVTDSRLTLHAGRFQFRRLLEGGVEIWEHQKTLIHQKILVVDERWCHVGSTNFDERSFDINAEISLGILDRGVAGELRAAFEDDLRSCRRVEPAAWRRRPWRERALDAAAFLVHEQI